jgi:hypothetical protein
MFHPLQDAIRKQYVVSCVDDIRRCGHFVLPAVKHLHDICKSYSSKTMSAYQKVRLPDYRLVC